MFRLSDGITCGSQIRDQPGERLVPIFANRPEHCRGMYGRQHPADTDWRGQVQHLTTLLGDPERTAEQGPGSCGAETDDQRWID